MQICRLKSIIKSVFFHITGGRPMKRVGFAFTDIVSGEMVYYYQDQLNGRTWMATHKWEGNRVRAKNVPSP